jgi:hypothetical protein
MACEIGKELRLKELDFYFSKSSFIESIIQDLEQLEISNLHYIPEERLESSYQETVDLCIQEKFTEPYLLESLLKIRDRRHLSIDCLKYVKEKLEFINQRYLNQINGIL